MDNSSDQWVDLIKNKNVYGVPTRDAYLREIEKAKKNSFFSVLKRHAKDKSYILEAGCATACTSFALAQLGHSLVALDISEHIIDGLKKLKPQITNNESIAVDYQVGNILEQLSNEKPYDLIFNHGVYEHFLDDKERAHILSHFYKALALGGKLIIAVPNLKNPLFNASIEDKHVPTMVSFSHEMLADELHKAGFDIIETGHLFVGQGFEEWLKYSFVAWPIRMVGSVWNILPGFLQRKLSAHIYCVSVKVK